MRILVTGATGFIGGRLLRRLTQMGHEVLGVGRKGLRKQIYEVTNYSGMIVHCDLEHYPSVVEVMNRFQPEVVFHLAGNPIVKEDVNFPCDIARTNVLATHHLLATCPVNTKFVFASSATVYGDYQGKPFEETDIPNPTSVYAVTKLSSEQLVEVYHKQGRVRSVIARLIANCGQGASHGLVHDILKKLRSPSENLSLFGTAPGSRKPFIHVDYTVEALINLGLRGHEGTFNVSTHSPISVEDVAEIAMTITSIRKPINWLGQGYVWQGDNQIVNVSCKKLSDLGILFVGSKYCVEKAILEEV